MSARANSLHTVVVDTLFFTGVMSLAAASWTAVADGAEPRIVHVAEAAPENRPSSDHIDSRLNTDDKPASGIPEESPAAKRESMMLGMKLFERAAGNIEVVDVAAASPAWDAGIRAGDRLREIDGVKPRRLADWVEDVGKVLANTEDGKSVAAEVERDGYPMQVRIKMPVSNVAEARDARKQDEELARMQAREQRQLKNGQQTGAPVGVGAIDRNDYGPGPAYGGYGGGYGGWGMGGFFDDGGGAAGGDANGGDRMATSAAAPLMAVNTLGRGGTGGAQGSGGQVGMAGFQNSGDGVEAMVVVRGLPQGTYQVGIGSGGEFGMDGTSNLVGPDANAAGFGLQPALEGTADSYNRGGVGPNQQQPGVNQPGAAPGMRGPNGNQVPNQQQPGFNQQQPGQPGFTPQGGQAPQGGGAAPGGVAPGAGGGAAPAGGDGASLANPRNAILAQQLDTQQSAGGAQNATRPVQPGALPGAGRNNQSATQGSNNSAADRGANPYDPRDRAEAQRQAQRGNNPLGGGGGSPMVASLGTLQIGPDGSGQVQNRLPGMSVRNLAGMQVIVQSTNWGGGGAGGTAVDPRVAQNPAQNPAAQNQFGQNPAAQGQARMAQGNAGQQVGQQPLDANGQPTRGAQGIVAAGTIQLRGGGGGTGANQQTGANPNAVDEATRREQGRSQISDPTQEFNPSNPLE